MFKSLSYKFANLLVKNEVIENEDFEKYIDMVLRL